MDNVVKGVIKSFLIKQIKYLWNIIKIFDFDVYKWGKGKC